MLENIKVGSIVTFKSGGKATVKGFAIIHHALLPIVHIIFVESPNTDAIKYFVSDGKVVHTSETPELLTIIKIEEPAFDWSTVDSGTIIKSKVTGQKRYFIGVNPVRKDWIVVMYIKDALCFTCDSKGWEVVAC